MDLLDRYKGCLLGLASGDAVGTTLEFFPPGTFKPIADMNGGGPFALAPGQWTDDTSMALCLAESLLEKNGFDAADQMTRYLNWWQWGYWSSTGQCFDIGTTIREALTHYQESGQPFAGSSDPDTAGNGSLMRLAPVVMYYFPSQEEVTHFAQQSSRTTHGAAEAVEACKLLAQVIANALAGKSRDQLLDASPALYLQPAIRELASGSFIGKPRAQIRGTGYCVASLEAALWCFWVTDSFEAAVLEAANLGDDADTTAAIVGQVAGAYYGKPGIPARWLGKLHQGDEIEGIASALYQAAVTRNAG
ncbi:MULTISPECIES: ADP-ribosylglycohydrolase family protein [unclassified Pseudomonas]|uniref:ADP-ribosylglycohydrolase family protein n=1 Tax=unclassified Pseudomonas TaxID=196821 RepID=UPI000DA9665E|nr:MULTISPECIES: ADP-ribosylglycohydrolase family protein [unclassified Pseudomonas]MDW3712707.1 ADP-ribosylglycohydrolase family protein [Pseudomonas sp. 2023EL-01195]PZE13404.1 ADP-ribosylglycohydrolase family protein [Pseudomonas sp. 57B-090624]